MKPGLAILLALVLLAAPRPVGAAVTLVLAPAAQQAARGTQLVFIGTLTNTSATEKVFLNALSAALVGASADFLVLEPNTFFANVPGILLPGETYTGVLFRLSLLGTAPAGDYAGTIMVKGGTDIFANSDLVGAPFAVYSPVVSVVATDPSASEFGPDPGTLTISRTGGTELALPVPYTLSGTAINGTTFAVIANSTVIAAGASSVEIPVVPLPDNLSQGERVLTLTLSESAAFNPGAATTASVTIHDKPADQWRFDKFGVAANEPEAQDLADWERDGIKNLVEYALDLDPKVVTTDAAPWSDTLDGYATFSYVPKVPVALDLIYEVEACADLLSWSTAHLEPVVVANPVPPNRVTVRYNFPIDSLDHIFFRLNVTRLDGPP